MAVHLAEALRAGAFAVGRPVPIGVWKYDGRRRFTVETTTLCASPELLILHGPAGRAFRSAAATVHPGSLTLEYFPAGRWYNVVSFFDGQTGALAQHFCNVMTPAVWEGELLTYVDLDLDLAVWSDGRAIVEDIEDFRRNARSWGYPRAVRRAAFAALRELRQLAAKRQAPFVGDDFAVAADRAVSGGVVWATR